VASACSPVRREDDPINKTKREERAFEADFAGANCEGNVGQDDMAAMAIIEIHTEQQW
jgi:hypothetical protein